LLALKFPPVVLKIDCSSVKFNSLDNSSEIRVELAPVSSNIFMFLVFLFFVKIFPNVINGIAVVAINRVQKRIDKMPLKHHQDGKCAYRVNKI